MAAPDERCFKLEFYILFCDGTWGLTTVNVRIDKTDAIDEAINLAREAVKFQNYYGAHEGLKVVGPINNITELPI